MSDNAIKLDKSIEELQAELDAARRELQIEASVERVRTKALVMRKSQDILAVVASLKNEMKHLGLNGVLACTIHIRQADGTYHITEMTGFELLKKIKDVPPPVPVCMMTAYDNDEYRGKAADLNCDEYVSKPIDFAALKDTIHSLVN